MRCICPYMLTDLDLTHNLGYRTLLLNNCYLRSQNAIMYWIYFHNHHLRAGIKSINLIRTSSPSLSWSADRLSLLPPGFDNPSCLIPSKCYIQSCVQVFISLGLRIYTALVLFHNLVFGFVMCVPSLAGWISFLLILFFHICSSYPMFLNCMKPELPGHHKIFVLFP